MNEDKVIEKLMEIGINKYEAKAYIALLNKPDITAYELSKLSGVPQAKIYETMSKLLDKNLVNIVSDNPVKYVAVDLESFLDSYKKRVNSTVKYLKDSLKRIDSTNKISYMLHLEGIENIRNKIKKVLARTNKFLYLEIWNIEYEYFKNELKLLEQKGVKIVSVLYGNVSEEIGTIYYHEMEEMESDVLKHGRWFTLVSDGEESLFAMFSEEKSQAIWTENKAFMLMAESFIVHDIYLAEVYKEYKEELDKKFGPNLKKIRQKIHI